MNSMTGYGRGEFLLAGAAYCVELRSYNNRFLDVKVRLPWGGKALEVKAEGAVRERVQRGRVEVSVWAVTGSGAADRLQLDKGLAKELGQLLSQLAQLTQTDLPTAARLLPPVKELMRSDPTDGLATDAAWDALHGGLNQALDGLRQMRATEGAATRQDLEQRLAEVRQLAQQLEQLADQQPLAHRERLQRQVDRWRDEGVSIEGERVAQEVALAADRSDVNEELARLRSHCEQMDELLVADEPVGRRMEFLLQEFHRELNTIASKTVVATVAHRVVEAKTAVERMREQAQNVE